MSNLTLLSPNSSYGDLLTTTNGGNGLDNVLRQLQDGYGHPSTITIATNAVNFSRVAGTFQLDGISLTASATDINNVCQPNPICTGNQAIIIPAGTTAQRPVPGRGGMIRYNTDINDVEIYLQDLAEWAQVNPPDQINQLLQKMDELLQQINELSNMTRSVK